MTTLLHPSEHAPIDSALIKPTKYHYSFRKTGEFLDSENKHAKKKLDFITVCLESH